MVAYSFKSRFVPMIAAGMKRQTIRAARKRHARPGEPVQVYQAMRTRHCRKILDPDPVCTDVAPIAIHFDYDGSITRISIRRYPTGWDEPGGWMDINPHKLDAFAQADGFADLSGMSAFWRQEHGGGGALAYWSGVLIQWAQGGPA